MDQLTNGTASNGHLHGNSVFVGTAAHTKFTNGVHEPSQEELERELPVVGDGQIPLGELVSRMAQAIYAELTELAETMPNMSDAVRKRTLAEWVVRTKKQVVKLYAVMRWARDAEVVQKAMNITAFLMDQNKQFEDAIHGLTYARTSLDPARLRNHDLLTSLDVLTTGSYRRLPTAIKGHIIPPTPLTDEEVTKTLSQMEEVIRYRLRMSEVIPLEMSRYQIADGRVRFFAPRLFEASLCLLGALQDDGWFFVDVEFLFTVGGDSTGMQEFPRRPQGPFKKHITDEADLRLGFYLPVQAPPPTVEAPPRPQLPEGLVDAPLVRVFNYLQMMSMSYQLEILWYQAERMRSLGWADYLTVAMTNDRRTLNISYWIRKQPHNAPGRPSQQGRDKIPPFGGTLTISIISTQPSPPLEKTTSPPRRTPKQNILAELQERAKIGGKRPSDEVDGLQFDVKWEPQKMALGIHIPPAATYIEEGELAINPDDLDVEALIRKVIWKHTRAILSIYQFQLQQGPTRNAFGQPGTVVLVAEGGILALRINLCADEVVIVRIDPRTGRLNLLDTGDLAAAGRVPMFALGSDRVNENPISLAETLRKLRISTITELAEQKANYLGLQSYRFRNFSPADLQKLGQGTRGTLYIQLSNSSEHYLVLVITDEEFRYALIKYTVKTGNVFADLVMEDIGWLDVRRIHSDALVGAQDDLGPRPSIASDLGVGSTVSFRLETQVLRELHTYCCARVAYAKVEQQFKTRRIPYAQISSSSGPSPPQLVQTQSSIARSIPTLCVQSSDILSDQPAAEAAMPNIRVIPLNWWSSQELQVLTCVKLKYVQEPVGKRAGTSAIIRPSKRVIYDKKEAVVCFLSDSVETCVTEFQEEWARVSKMVLIAREVAQMATKRRWNDVRLLSFDLQTVEFAYAADYSVSITCIDQLAPSGGSYELRFSRPRLQDDEMNIEETGTAGNRRYNPHADVEPFMRNILRHRKIASSLHRLVGLLRDTLPIVLELQAIREHASKMGEIVDTFAKAAGWFRVLYGDLRHALDFRLLKDARVAILDASHSLFHTDGGSVRAAPLPQGSRSLSQNVSTILQPLPEFRSLISEVVSEVGKDHGGRISPIDIGVICSADSVPLVGRVLCGKVLQRLKSATAT